MSIVAGTGIALEDELDEKKFHSIKSRLINREGKTYYDFKKTLKPNYTKIALDITSGWLVIFGCVFIGIYTNQLSSNWLKLFVSLADAILLGFAVNYLSNFFHEAAHFNIAPGKLKNDLLANMFLGILQAQHIKHYRVVHWKHHINLGTPEDTEHSYFDALSLRFFFESLTGIRAIRVFLFRSNNTKSGEKEDDSLKNQKRMMLFAAAVFHLIVLFIFIITTHYWMVGIWLAGFGTFFPFFASLRQLLEHRDEWANKNRNYFKTPHGKINRIFSGRGFAASFGSAGFDRHLLHHLEPQISYTNLKELDLFLQETFINDALKKRKTTYLKTFISLIGK